MSDSDKLSFLENSSPFEMGSLREGALLYKMRIIYDAEDDVRSIASKETNSYHATAYVEIPYSDFGVIINKSSKPKSVFIVGKIAVTHKFAHGTMYTRLPIYYQIQTYSLEGSGVAVTVNIKEAMVI